MASFGDCGAAMSNIAYEVIMKQAVTRLGEEFTEEEFDEFERNILSASQKVSTTLTGGKHGPAFLVLDEAGLRELTGD